LTPVGTNEGGGGTYNNLFDAHPPFQIDGNFGCTSGITEMLMQSAGGEIHLLPALPRQWPNGSISGLRAIGGFEITGMEWKDAKLVRLVIKSNLGGNLRLRVPNTLMVTTRGLLRRAAGNNPNAFFETEKTAMPIISPKASVLTPQLKETFLYDIKTEASKTYILVSM
jgi:alpha-L-fucosidase 2